MTSAFLAIAMGIAGTLAASHADAPPPSIEVWVSTTDMTGKLAVCDPIPFVPAKKKTKLPVVSVNPDQTYQSMVGVGASLEHATCYNLSLLPPEKRAAILESLVSPQTGIGMSLMRICIGTSDFVGEPWYSYDDIPPGEADPDLARFSIEKDRAYVLPVIKTALEKNPKLRFFASPWSPPAWMKSSGDMCGGYLLPEYYEAFARYLVKFVQAYEAEGVPILALTLQNEPGVNVKTYPSCFWTGEKQAAFLKDHMGPALEAAGLKTTIWCFDHNFNNLKFPEAVLADKNTARYVEGTAFHHYEGKPEAMSVLHDEFPEKSLYFTEGSTYGVFGAAKIVSFFRNWARTYNAWVTIIDENGKPNNGPHDCSPTCIVLNSKTLEVEYRFDYYMYGHFSKFIEPGALRIASDGDTPRFANVAFRQPDGSIALIVVNTEKDPREFLIRSGDREAKVTLEGKSIATYRWR